MKGNEKLIKKFFTDKVHITVEDCDRFLTPTVSSIEKAVVAIELTTRKARGR